MSEKGSKTMSTFTVEQVRQQADYCRAGCAVNPGCGEVAAPMLDAYAETLGQHDRLVKLRSHFTEKIEAYTQSTEGNTWTDGYIDGVVEVLNYLDHQSSETGAPMNEGPLDLVDGITGRAGVPRE